MNNDALARFNQVYPDVKITYEPQPSDYQTKLLAQIKGGSEPDVFYVDPGLAYQFIPNNVLLDLTPALAETGRSKDDYFPSLIDTFIGQDGKIYGLPKDFGSLALFYNTDMVKTPPKEGWTQDDFAAFVKENNSGSGQAQVFGFSTDPDFERWGAFALANGAKIIDNNKCAINSDTGVATLDWWYGMYKDRYRHAPGRRRALAGRAKPSPRSAPPASRRAAGSSPSWTTRRPPSASSMTLSRCPSAKTAARRDLLFFNAWGASAKSKFRRPPRRWRSSSPAARTRARSCRPASPSPPLKGFENDPFFQKGTVQSKISKLIYEAASYGTADYYGGINDPKVKKAINDATAAGLRQAADPKAALDQACQEVDPRSPPSRSHTYGAGPIRRPGP